MRNKSHRHLVNTTSAILIHRTSLTDDIYACWLWKKREGNASLVERRNGPGRSRYKKLCVATKYIPYVEVNKQVSTSRPDLRDKLLQSRWYQRPSCVNKLVVLLVFWCSIFRVSDNWHVVISYFNKLFNHVYIWHPKCWRVCEKFLIFTARFT